MKRTRVPHQNGSGVKILEIAIPGEILLMRSWHFGDMRRIEAKSLRARPTVSRRFLWAGDTAVNP